MQSEIIEVRAIIRGYVQGIGFRATARTQANRLGVKGTARNLADGTVEVFAQGNKHQIDKLFQAIEKDIGADNIQDIERTPVPLHEYDGFHIIH